MGPTALYKVRGLSPIQIQQLEQLPRRNALLAYVSGSAIDGLGNEWSDIDVFVVGACNPIGTLVEAYLTHTVSIHYIEEQRIDFEFWHPDRITKLARALIEFREDKMEDDLAPSISEQKFIHGLFNAHVIFGNIAAFTGLFDLKRLSEIQLVSNIRQTDYLHEDICGMVESKDYISTLPLCRRLLEHSLAALLNSRGNTNPSLKWQLRLANKFLVESSPLDEWWKLQFSPALYPIPSNDILYRHVIQCIRLSERMIAEARP